MYIILAGSSLISAKLADELEQRALASSFGDPNPRVAWHSSADLKPAETNYPVGFHFVDNCRPYGFMLSRLRLRTKMFSVRDLAIDFLKTSQVDTSSPDYNETLRELQALKPTNVGLIVQSYKPGNNRQLLTVPTGKEAITMETSLTLRRVRATFQDAYQRIF